MPRNPRPRSRNPTSWPPVILQAIEIALDHEFLIPLESDNKVKQWRQLLNDIRRSFREHNHPDWERVNALRAMFVETHTIQRERPSYGVDALQYPFTCVMSPAVGFLPNLNQAVSFRNPSTTEPPVQPIDIPTATLERELSEIISEELSQDDGNELAEFFRSRRVTK